MRHLSGNERIMKNNNNKPTATTITTTKGDQVQAEDLNAPSLLITQAISGGSSR